MLDLAGRAIDTATARGASYADIRIISQESQTVVVKNGKVLDLSQQESLGFGVRVIADGAWGFAASNIMTAREIDRVSSLAVRIAKASGRAKTKEALLGPPVKVNGRYVTPVEKDPFSVSLEDKVALLLETDKEMRGVAGLSIAESSIEAFRERKTFVSSEGTSIEQEITQTGCGIEATAVQEGEVQKRSYPNSVGRHMGSEGYEFVEKQQLPQNARRIAEEAVALLSADQCPSGITTIVLDSTQLALQLHESCGHPIELDRVFGDEAAYAGTSFLTVDKLGNFQYGSEIVNVTADATYPGGLGTFGYDDEGIPAQSIPIIRNGLFVGYLMSRESADVLGMRSNGCARADGWARIPIIRMTNVNLEPGAWRFEDLIADTDDGIYMQTNSSWSIDDKRLNFQFGAEIAWEIKNGKLGRMLKNPTYTGITPQFWGSCDAICSSNYWNIWGTPNCGKGQPSQTAHVGHGTAPARFRNVQVGLIG